MATYCELAGIAVPDSLATSEGLISVDRMGDGAIFIGSRDACGRVVIALSDEKALALANALMRAYVKQSAGAR